MTFYGRPMHPEQVRRILSFLERKPPEYVAEFLGIKLSRVLAVPKWDAEQ